jgi:IS605 OrfB family transposase
MLKEKSDRISEKNKKRNKLFALARKNEKKNTKEGKKKSKSIRKYNLGRIKANRQKSKDHATIESYVNHSLNNFFENDKPSEIVDENLNFNSWNKKLPKKVKRYFSSWLKGLLRKRIEYKAMVNGVHHTTVNPAYSSQLCPICGYLDSKNRKGDKFECLNCGVELDADYCGSLNLKNRKDDKEITLYTPYKKVKEILLRRFTAGGNKFKFATGSAKTLDTSTQIEVNQRAKHSKNYTNLS